MAYISKITPLGSSTTYDLKASLLINTHVTSEAAAIPATKGLFGVYTTTSDSSGLSNDGHILSGTWHNNDSNFGYQLFIDTDPTYKMALRQRNSNGVWQAWKLIPMADGTNASGTWGISISGNAATAIALTSNAGSTTQPIYFTGGKPAVTSYSLSASVGSGTNHKLVKYTGTNSIGDSGIEDIDQIGYSTVTPGYTSGGEQYYKAWMAYLCTHYSNANVMIGTALPNSRGPVIGNIYDVNTKDSTTGLPQYATFLFHNLGAHLESFGTSSYNYWHRTYLDDSNYTSYTDSRYVKKAGDTMSGNLIVSKTGDTYVEAKNTTTGCRIEIDVNDAGQHGLWSSGYYANSTYTASSKWILYRSTDGEAHTGLKLYGAVWNDYAEYRICKENPEPGRCVIETGKDDLVLSTERLQPGAEIISDTFGFAIGETDKAKTPIAATGRVLAYIYEGREAARTAIGKPVCSGPNGTVSIMTDEEYQQYGYCAIGTISAVPDYEEWGTENIKVNNRIWIRIR